MAICWEYPVKANDTNVNFYLETQLFKISSLLSKFEKEK